ncbi:MAG: EscU/YscU/HrcU family type III secretion system export apparatus switch protein [Rickettsiales bacterium]
MNVNDRQVKLKKIIAVALKYKRENPAPKIAAKGQGTVAEQIIKIAEKNNISIVKDEDLTAILSILEVDDYIPFEAYAAVAGILQVLHAANKIN